MIILRPSVFLVLSRMSSGKLSFVLTSTVLTLYINCRLAIVRQDALLSLALEQSPASQEMSLRSNLPSLHPKAFPGEHLDYRQAMNWLCHLALRHTSPEAGFSDILLSKFYDLFQEFHHLNATLDYSDVLVHCTM